MAESRRSQAEGEDSLDARVGRIFNDFVDRRARGEAVSEADLLAQYPEYADELKGYLELLQDMRSGIPSAGPQGGPTSDTMSVPHPAIEGYEILREIHRGGQGAVYQAVQKSTKRKVAIKVLLQGPYASATASKRFEREVELVAQLKHPNIIAIFDSGTTDSGTQFYVMDYVRGLPLHRHVSEKKLTLEATLELICSVCAAVQYAHQRGVIHRDLKPSNILVDAEGVPRVLDFGLAKSLIAPVETVVSLSQNVVGTLPYMSPEQAGGNPDEIDIRTDIYALGVILYELLTGGFPYPIVGQLGDVLRHISETPPTPPTRRWTVESGIVQRSRKRLRANECPIDDEVQTIVLKALAKERERRYQSAGELAGDIQHYLAGEPIVAKGDSRWYVLRKALRRYRVLAVATVTSVIVGIGFGVTMTLMYQRLDLMYQRAVLERNMGREAFLNAVATDVVVDPIKPTTILARFGDSADFKAFYTFPDRVGRVNGISHVDPDGIARNGHELVVAGLERAWNDSCLVAFNTAREEVWRASLSPRFVFDWPDYEGLQMAWRCFDVASGNVDGHIGDEIVAAGSDTEQYPACISIIEPRSGRPVSRFWHMGHVRGVRIVPDFFSPGHAAIIAWGINNKLDGFGLPHPPRPYECAEGEDPPVTEYDLVPVMMILDPRALDGIGPPGTPLTESLRENPPYAYAFLDLSADAEGDFLPRGENLRRFPRNSETGRIINVTAAHTTTSDDFHFKVHIQRYPWGSRFAGGLFVDQNLEFKSFSHVAAEGVGGTQQYWRKLWKPIIQRGVYLAD